MKLKDHILGDENKKIIPEDFIFFDTETSTKIIDKEQHLTLKVGWAYYWKRGNEPIKKEFKKISEFWDFILSIKSDDLWIYAHNIDFDFKIVDGFRELILRRKFDVDKVYLEGKIFMLTFKNGEQKLRFYDTFNYVPMSLEKIGKAIGYKKLYVDFDKVDDKTLSEYCKNDVEIIYQFIKSIIYFLEENDLGSLKPTSASLSMSAFKYKFYDKVKYPIFIHANQGVINLERKSYKGGITDCLKVGKFKNNLIKLDINSMYPYIMKKFESPVKLIPSAINIEINNIPYFNKKYYLIADMTIKLPKDKAYILTKFKTLDIVKSGFLYGEFRESLCSPEIDYVLKNGQILKIHKIAIYEKRNIFNDYVDFFYNKRLEYKKQGNETYVLLCKLFMNSLYGKFAQRSSKYTLISENEKIDLQKYKILRGDEKDYIEEITILHMGKKIFKMENTNKNSFDSFVAISSFITSYARMFLVELIEKVERKNVYYIDTDCLIINKESLPKIKEYLDDLELGKLKNEGESNYGIFYKPKYYEFNREKKCKGVKKVHKTIFEDDEAWFVEYDNFERFKTAITKDSLHYQKISKIQKRISKHYDKGKIALNGDIIPFNADEVIQ